MAIKQLIFFRRIQLYFTRYSWALLLAVLSALGQLTYGGLTGKIMAAPASVANGCPLVQEGRAKYEAGQFQEARAAWQQASLTETGFLCRAMALSNLALAEEQLGKLVSANQAIQQSLQLIRREADTTDSLRVLAQALNTQGKLELAQGQADSAIKTWQQASAAYQKVGDSAGVIRSQINTAQALQTLGQYREAGNILLQVLGIPEQPNQDFPQFFPQAIKKFPDSPTKFVLLHSLGNVYLLLGDYKSATNFLQASKQLAEGLRWAMPTLQSDALLSLGNVERSRASRARNVDDVTEALTKAQAAMKFYQSALEVSTAPTQKVTLTQVQALLNQLSLSVETEEWLRKTEQQSTFFTATDAEKAEKISSQIDTLPLSAAKVYARINFAQSLIRLVEIVASDAPTNSDPNSEVIQMLNTARAEAREVGNKRLESYALGTLGNLYETTRDWDKSAEYTLQAQLLAAQSMQAEDIGYQWEWQLGRIRKKQGKIPEARANYQAAVKSLQSLRGDLVGLNSEVQFSFRDKVEPIYRELVELLLTTEGNSKPSQENLQQALEQIKALQLAELENYLRCDLQNSNAAAVNQVPDEKAAIIYPIILENRLAVIYQTPGQRLLEYSETAISRNQVEKTLKKLRGYLSLGGRTPDILNQAQEVYGWLREPLQQIFARGDRIDTLVFVLDSTLRNIPMGVLYDGEQYLVQKNYALAVALPRLQFDNRRPSASRLNVFTGGVGEPQTIKDIEFPKIEKLREELEGIGNSVTAKQPVLNENFTKANLQQQIQSGDYSAIHFKTHGVFSSDPEFTFIVGYQEALEGKDLAKLIQTRGGNIELLVLSACETAKGDNRAALGLAGLALQAGARSTLSTLWKVQDVTNTELMLQFYQELAKPGTTKARALHLAQQALFERYPDPYFWAPYILVGL